MKIIGHLAHHPQASAELTRAARLLELSLDMTQYDRQVIRLAEQACDSQEAALVVTTDSSIHLLRELLARAPSIRVLLITLRPLSELPYFLSLCPIVSGFFMSPSGHCGAEYFVQFLRQETAPKPLLLSDHLESHQKTITLMLKTMNDKKDILERASEFFLWCLGDNEDPSHLARARQLEQALDELLVNASQHGHEKTNPLGPVEAHVQLGFDGSLLGIRVQDPYGCLRRHNLLDRLAARPLELPQPIGSSDNGTAQGYQMILANKQRVIINLVENVSTEVICLTRLSARKDDTSGQPVALEIRSWPRFAS